MSTHCFFFILLQIDLKIIGFLVTFGRYHLVCMSGKSSASLKAAHHSPAQIDQLMDLNTFIGFWLIAFIVIIEETQIVSPLASGSLLKFALGHFHFFSDLVFIIVIYGRVRSSRRCSSTLEVELHYVHSKSWMINRKFERMRVS